MSPVADRTAPAHRPTSPPGELREAARRPAERQTVGRPRPPWGVLLFLAYAFLILAGVALALPTVIDLAIDTPVSFIGVVVMALLAYTIFTITLFLQRKAAARTLGLGLASLTLPPIAILLLSGLAIPALFLAALGALLFRGLTRPATSRWLDEL
jgi:hypothetical protein